MHCSSFCFKEKSKEYHWHQQGWIAARAAYWVAKECKIKHIRLCMLLANGKQCKNTLNEARCFWSWSSRPCKHVGRDQCLFSENVVCIVPQTEFAMRGSYGVVKGAFRGHRGTSRSFGSETKHYLVTLALISPRRNSRSRAQTSILKIDN